jgi:hypothetical protein
LTLGWAGLCVALFCATVELVPITRANLKGYLSRDWAKVRSEKTGHVRSRIAALGAPEALRYMEILRIVEPKDDEAEIAHQTRVAKLLQCIDQRAAQRLAAVHRRRV